MNVRIWAKQTVNEFKLMGWQVKVLLICILFLILFAISMLFRNKDYAIYEKIKTNIFKIIQIDEKIQTIKRDSVNVIRHDSVLRTNGIKIIERRMY